MRCVVHRGSLPSEQIVEADAFEDCCALTVPRVLQVETRRNISCADRFPLACTSTV